MTYNFQPSMQTTTYNPDQLIAGSLDIVTDTVTLAAGYSLTRGTLIGQQSANLYAATSTAANSSGGSNTGNGTMGSVTVNPGAKFGTYRVNFTSSTAYAVTDPSGDTVGAGTTGTAFSSTALGFTITAGVTAFAANDGFNVVVEETAGTGNGYYVPATATATDGSQDPKNWAILAMDVDTSNDSTGTNAATSAPVYIGGEFDSNYMTFGTGLTAAGVKAALKQAGSSIFIKTGAINNTIV